MHIPNINILSTFAGNVIAYIPIVVMEHIKLISFLFILFKLQRNIDVTREVHWLRG